MSQRKVLLYQNLGFLAIMALTWLNEITALPALVFGDNPLILNFHESALKMLLVFAVWFLVAGSTRRILAHLRYLEEFMRICSWCHHVRHHDEWISMEEFLRRGFDTPTTHGICPACLAKQKAAIEQVRKAAEAAGHSTPNDAPTAN